MIVVAVLILLIFFRKKGDTPPMRFKDIAVGSAKGVINTVANFFLVIALAHVDASVQYPMVTGGVMIVSTLICFFGKNKPSKKEILSVVLSFIGLLLMFIIPV
jgi:drug/metabolite transporter (DMT)-like permease